MSIVLRHRIRRYATKYSRCADDVYIHVYQSSNGDINAVLYLLICLYTLLVYLLHARKRKSSDAHNSQKFSVKSRLPRQRVNMLQDYTPGCYYWS